MTTATMDYIGTIDLLDVQIINEHFGQKFVPYPFRFVMPPRFETADEAMGYAVTVPDRFQYGDLAEFHDALAAYVNADVRVECHVQFIPDDVASVRVVAYREGAGGYLASQRPDSDALDLYSLSPYDLGLAIVDFVPVDAPGQHPTIVVPEFAPAPGPLFEEGERFVERVVSETVEDARAPLSDLTVYSTIQSHWRPTRRWGVDTSKAMIVWFSVRADGDYVYDRDYRCARPLVRSVLRRRIDELISEDVLVLREFRSE